MPYTSALVDSLHSTQVERFSDYYLFTEYHSNIGPPLGTVAGVIATGTLAPVPDGIALRNQIPQCAVRAPRPADANGLRGLMRAIRLRFLRYKLAKDFTEK